MEESPGEYGERKGDIICGNVTGETAIRKYNIAIIKRFWLQLINKL
jgi:hypothetical protein